MKGKHKMLMPIQPFPLTLYFEGLNVPQGITVGNTHNNTPAFIHDKDLNVHHFLLGKTGAGKTYFLYLYLSNKLALGKRFFMIDPLGSTYILLENYVAYMTREYFDTNSFEWFKREFLDNIVFIDLSKEDHPFRSNLLAPIGNENTGQTINRVMKFFDAEFRPKDSVSDGLDLQRQRRQGLFSLIAIFIVTKTSLLESKRFVYDEDFRETLIEQASQKSQLPEIQEAIAYWRFVKQTFKGTSYGQLVLSLLTALSSFFESKIVRHFLLTNECNLDWQNMFAEKTVIFKLPINDLATRSILMNFLYTGVIFNLIAKREVTDLTDNLYIVSDESGVIFDTNYSDTITRSRNKKVFFISAMQSRKQGLSDQGMRVIDIIEEQSDVCIYFRGGKDDAIQTVEEKIVVSGKRIKHIEKTTSISKSFTETHSTGFAKALSFMKTLMYGQSSQESYTKNFTETIGFSETESSSETLSKQFSLAEAYGETKSVNIGKTFNVSWTKGNTVSKTTTDGFSLTQSEGRSIAHIETENGGVTISESTGSSDTISSGVTQSLGSSKSKSDSYQYDIRFNGRLLNDNRSASNGLSEQQSEAYQNAKSQSNNYSKGKSQQSGFSKGKNFSESGSEALALSKSLGDSVSVLRNFAEGIAEQYSSTRGFSLTNTATQGVGESFARSHGVSKNRGASIGDALGKTVGEQVSRGKNHGESLTENESYSQSTGESATVSFKNVYYTMLEEKELAAQELRDLPPRRFLLCVKNEKPVLVTTATCYALPTKRGQHDFLDIIRKYNNGEKTNVFPQKKLGSHIKQQIEIISELDIANLHDDFAHVFQKTKFGL